MHDLCVVNLDGDHAVARLAPPGRRARHAPIPTRSAIAVLFCALLAACGGDMDAPSAAKLTEADTPARAPAASPTQAPAASQGGTGISTGAGDVPAPIVASPVWHCATAC